jgi:hypothetical protein
LIESQNDYLIFRFGLKIVEQNIENKNEKQQTDVILSRFFYSIYLNKRLYLGRREAHDKSQRTDGESTATGSSTPSANSSSSLSSVGQEAPANVDHSHHLVGCPTIPSHNSDSSGSDLSLGIQTEHSPNYSQQPLALTTNGRLNNNNNKSISINNNYRKETFPINHMRQHMISTTTTNNNNSAPYIKL